MEPFCCRGEKIPIPAWNTGLLKGLHKHLSQPGSQALVTKMKQRLRHIDKTASLPIRFIQYIQEVSTQFFIFGHFFKSTTPVTIRKQNFFKLNQNIYILLLTNVLTEMIVLLNVTSGMVEIFTNSVLTQTMSFETLLMDQFLTQTEYVCYCNTCSPLIIIPQIPLPQIPNPNQNPNQNPNPNPNPVANEQIHIFAVNYNVLRIMAGMHSLAYGNDHVLNNNRILFNRSIQFDRQRAESRARMIARTQTIKEELISNVFHPRRIDAWLNSGVAIEDL